MIPRQHQIEGASWALSTIRDYGIAYLAWQERTGKTLTALVTVENSKADSCLIITKKKAIDGWEETLKEWKHTTKFTVINYESTHKIVGSFDFIILDESHHSIASINRTSKTWREVAKHTKQKPILYLSATPYAETVGQLYHQFKLSSWTPWKKYSNYYNFHRAFGIPTTIYTSYGPQPDRSKFRTEEVLDTCEELFSFKTRKDVHIKYEPTINVIKIPLNALTKKMIKEWKDRRVLQIGEHGMMGDSDSKMRSVHYQLEGGTLKINDKTSIILASREKIDYIKENYDTSKIAVMAHFIKERELLQRELPNALILSSDGHAEGVNLMHIDKLIIYSMSFKTSKHTQRTARQADHNRATPIVVDILVADKPGVGLAVYNCVAIKKENFIKSSYERSIK